ncbi:hypothetical protein PYW07_000104 [Mythimna separata]|uniref:Uncharacterized protein n=1 Tax=Mythimna separata TaxID=271217 RepID=A0AAD7Z111_MYTSE|nr:hypothetical protein PYW07_000104 [Mythimna separata]
MSENPSTWKKKDNPVERDPKHRRNSSTNQGVKLFSKGKMLYIEDLPTDTVTFHNKEALFDRTHPRPRDDGKKAKKNKLCQIITPNEIVEGITNRCKVVSMDTTVDRPCCCCSAKTNQNSENNSNKQVAQVLSDIITPVLDKEGMIGKPFHTTWGIYQRESIKSETLTPCNNPPSRPQRTRHHTTAPSQQLNCAPTQQYTRGVSQQYSRAFSQQHNRAPIQQLSCAPTHRLTWSFDQQNTETCRTQREDCSTTQREDCSTTQRQAFPTQREVCPSERGVCPTQYRNEADCAQHPEETCPNPNSAETCPLCQCSPELLLKLFKIAIKGGDWRGMPSYVCGECPEPPAPAPPTPAPSAKSEPGDPCLCKEPEGSIVKEGPNSKTQTGTEPTCPCDIGETKQKRGSIRQTRFNSTVGTSTDPPRKKAWWSWKKNDCECPKEPEQVPESEAKPKSESKAKSESKLKSVPAEVKAPELMPLEFDPEPYLTLQSYFQQKDVILSEEILKKNSLETERVSGFRLSKEKTPPPEPESVLSPEDAIRYLAMMNPDVFRNIMAEQQAKLDGTYIPPPPPTPTEVVLPPQGKEAEGAFKGLKFKIGGRGSASKGLSGVCCFDLLTESFTTW